MTEEVSSLPNKILLVHSHSCFSPDLKPDWKAEIYDLLHSILLVPTKNKELRW